MRLLVSACSFGVNNLLFHRRFRRSKYVLVSACLNVIIVRRWYACLTFVKSSLRRRFPVVIANMLRGVIPQHCWEIFFRTYGSRRVYYSVRNHTDSGRCPEEVKTNNLSGEFRVLNIKIYVFKQRFFKKIIIIYAATFCLVWLTLRTLLTILLNMESISNSWGQS